MFTVIYNQHFLNNYLTKVKIINDLKIPNSNNYKHKFILNRIYTLMWCFIYIFSSKTIFSYNLTNTIYLQKGK